MSERAQQLAEQFEQITDELITTVEATSSEQWAATCQEEGWTVAATAHHVAVSNEGIFGFIQAIANGQAMPPLTSEMLDQGNAEHARQYASCDKQETLDLLRRSSQNVLRQLRSWSDEQLDNASEVPLMGNQRVSAEQAIQMVLIGHPTQHLASIRSAR